MIRNYPSHINLKNRFNKLCGHHVGILESQLLMAAKGRNFPHSNLCTVSMPNYHKLLIHEQAEMSYHLSGYGIYREEAMVRLLGEGIERYALLIAPTLYRNRIEYGTYNEMKQKGEIIPWDYIKIYSDKDYEILSKKTIIRNISPDDMLGWLKCPSIFDKNREIYIPAQLLFTGYQVNKDLGEKFFSPGFSKGTAAHVDLKKALKGAIIEAVEADALMIRWYTSMKSRKVIIDNPTLLNVISELLGGFSYEILAYEYNLPELPGNTYGLALMHRKENRPFVVMGCQTSLDPVKGLYRAILEAMAILYLANYGPLVMPDNYLETTEEKDYLNLDSNVAYWSVADEIELKRSTMYNLLEGEVALTSMTDFTKDSDDEELKYLLNEMHGISEYGVYLDITPPETEDKGWKVIRTFFPELVQMSFPGFPYSNHPRIKKYGGITNGLPHPLP